MRLPSKPLDKNFRWLDPPGTLRWLGSPPVGVGLTQDQLDALPAYQACIGAAIVKCNAAFPNWQSDADQKTGLNACIEASKGACKIQVETSQAMPALSPQAISDLQKKVNDALKKWDYCPIGVDGKLGGETCGALIWAASSGEPIAVPAQCNGVKNTFQLKDCKGAQVTPKTCPETPCQPNQDCINGKCYGKCPGGQQHDAQDPAKCVPIPAVSSGTSPWAIFGLAAAAMGGIFLASRGQLKELGGGRGNAYRDNPRKRHRGYAVQVWDPDVPHPLDSGRGGWISAARAGNKADAEVKAADFASEGYQVRVKKLF